MVMRWKAYLDRDVFILSVPADTPLGSGPNDVVAQAKFWTTPWPYWNMENHAPELFNSLRGSDLVVFKVIAALFLG